MDKSLLEILVCPQCRSSVQQSGDWIVCTQPSCGLRYPIRDGIPVMLIDEALKPGQTRQ